MNPIRWRAALHISIKSNTSHAGTWTRTTLITKLNLWGFVYRDITVTVLLVFSQHTTL